jgi:hypothetical protein
MQLYEMVGEASGLPRRLGLGWHWLWFIPLCVLVLLLIELHTVVLAFNLSKLAWERWSWGVLVSPSSAFCLSVIAFSVTFPLYSLGLIGFLVAERQQWRWVLLIAVVILLLPVVTDTLLWGSFPLTFDNQGVARLRLIPFIPWPSGDYLEF